MRSEPNTSNFTANHFATIGFFVHHANTTAFEKTGEHAGDANERFFIHHKYTCNC